MIIRGLLSALLAAIALGSLVFIYQKTSSIDSDSYNKVISNINELERLDAAWNVEVLKSHAALSQDYDEIASYLPAIREHKATLGNSELADPSLSSPQISALLKSYFDLLDEKEQSIERYKSENSVLRNSTRFLPEAAETLIDAATQNEQTNLASRVKDAYSLLSTYSLLTQTEMEENILSSIHSLRSEIESYPADVAIPLGIFLSHADVILNFKTSTNTLLEEAVATPTSAAASKLHDAYTAFHEQRIKSVEKYQLALIFYAGAMLLMLIFVAYKLFQFYRSLKTLNTALKDSNETLEAKVAERTKYLSKALKDLKNSQAQLVNSEKLAAIGQMVAGVAHEINTPLGYVNSNVDITYDLIGEIESMIEDVEKLGKLLNNPNTDEEELSTQFTITNDHIRSFKNHNVLPETKELLNDAKYGLSQIADIVTSLKDFSRMDRSAVANINVHDSINSALKISHNLTKHIAEIVTEYGDIPRISCTPSQLNQVFLNLVTNAAHAIDSTGRTGIIKVTTRTHNDYVVIEIKDNGAGMDEETMKHIFEPFFTTKEVGKGTGLGLPISYKIIKEHNGIIKVRSKRGVGTNFLIALPTASPETSKETLSSNELNYSETAA